MRGAHRWARGCPTSRIGSSPHAWGTPHHTTSDQSSSRFIPTCVGHTAEVATANGFETVHPHMRGAHTPSGLLISRQRGSSPHAWGTHGKRVTFLACGRFIPTCVGHTTRVLRVHQSLHGSSPHAWGTPRQLPGVRLELRFIPTCVGHTPCLEHCYHNRAVHPHMRGAHGQSGTIYLTPGGSSPHAWGTPARHRGHERHGRFIPTCVGHTKSWF